MKGYFDREVGFGEQASSDFINFIQNNQGSAETVLVDNEKLRIVYTSEPGASEGSLEIIPKDSNVNVEQVCNDFQITASFHGEPFDMDICLRELDDLKIGGTYSVTDNKVSIGGTKVTIQELASEVQMWTTKNTESSSINPVSVVCGSVIFGLLVGINIVKNRLKHRKAEQKIWEKQSTGQKSGLVVTDSSIGYTGKHITADRNPDWSLPNFTAERAEEYLKEKAYEIASRVYSSGKTSPEGAISHALETLNRDFKAYLAPAYKEAYEGWGDSRLKGVLEELEDKIIPVWTQAQIKHLEQQERDQQLQPGKGDTLNAKVIGDEIIILGITRSKDDTKA